MFHKCVCNHMHLTYPQQKHMFPIDLLDPPEFLGTSGNGRVSSQTIQKGGVKIFKAPRIYWCYKLYTFLCHGQVCWIWGKAPSIVYRVNPYSRHRISIMGWSVPIWSWYRPGKFRLLRTGKSRPFSIAFLYVCQRVTPSLLRYFGRSSLAHSREPLGCERGLVGPGWRRGPSSV